VGDRGWALVTGAERRIGRTLALCVAAAGYDVLAHARTAEKAEDTVDAVRRGGQKALTVAGDLSDPDVLPRLIAAGPSPPSLLVNCASLFAPDEARTFTAAGLDAAYAANLRAPLLLAQAFANALPEDQRGAIVNILDQRIWRLTPLCFTYTITKSALWTATQTLAQALAPRVRVNAIGPGPTLASIHQTPAAFAAEAAATPLGAPVDPEEVAQALLFLINAPSVTGQMIAVDGGQHLAWRTPDVTGE